MAVGFYLLGRLWQLAMIGSPVVAADTPMYRAADQGWLDFTVVNFVGTDLRPWPVTLLYALVPSDGWRVLAQFALASCCWAWCILQFRHITSHRALGVAGPFLVAVLALTIGISGFDVVLLSESVTLSLVALYVGGVVSLCFRGLGVSTLAVTFAAASMLGLLRPVLVPLIACVALVPCLEWLGDRRRAGAHRRSRPFLAAVAAVTVVLAGMSSAYAWSYNVRSDKAWGDWLGTPGLNGRTLTQYYLAAYHTPSGPDLVRAMVDAGAPRCINHTASPDGLGTNEHRAIDQVGCPEGLAWLSAHFLPTMVRHLASDPGAARLYFRDVLRDQATLRSDGLRSVPTPVPSALTSLFFGDGTGAGDPLVLWSIVALLVVLLRWQRLGRPPPAFLWSTATPEPPASTAAKACVAAVLVAAYLALLGTAVLSASDASRVALPVTTLLRLALLVVVVRAGSRVLTGPAPERADTERADAERADTEEPAAPDRRQPEAPGPTRAATPVA